MIGASGMVGSRLVDEASSRGHFVIGMARDAGRIAQRGAVWPVAGDVTDSEPLQTLARGAEVIVGAVSPRGRGDPIAQAQRYARALAATATAAGVRLLMVGGAGSLRLPNGKMLVETLPDDMLEPRAMVAARNAVAESHADWTYFSPALHFDPGERSGNYRLGTTDLLFDANGECRISVEDYCAAMVDEIERPTYRRGFMAIAY